MEPIFRITEKTGKIIYLSKKGWKHISQEHPYLSKHLEKIKEVIVKPLHIQQSIYDENVQYYYNWLKEKKKYLMVVVKYLNGTGFIITSFYRSNLKK